MIVRKIQLLGKYKNLYALVDAEDFGLVNNYRWWGTKPSVRSKNIYPFTQINKKTVYMHRLIVRASKLEEIDHKNLDSLDNRKNNLRICTRAENIHNAEVRKNCKSGLKGVSLASETRRKKKWRARVRVNGKEKVIGYFFTKEEAGEAFDKEAKKYHGEFARLNFLL